MVWKTQLKTMMRNSKAKSALSFWDKTGLERGIIVWVEVAVFKVLILRLLRELFVIKAVTNINHSDKLVAEELLF